MRDQPSILCADDGIRWMKPVRFVFASTAVLGIVITLLWLQPLLTLRLQHNDAWMHLLWADQFHTALSEGTLLPRWAYACLDGLGDPSFVYYQPLFYYIDSFFQFLGAKPHYALLLTTLMAHVLLATMSYRLIAGYCSQRWALASTVFVVMSPSLLFIPFAMGFLPWALGVPLSAWFVIESVRAQPRIARLAVLLCLTALAHLLSGLIALSCAALARLVADGLARAKLRVHLGWGLSVIVGLSLAAFFVYPALTQLHLINPDGWTANKTFDWRSAMLFPTFTAYIFGSRWMAFQWYMPIIVLGMALLVIFGERQPGALGRSGSPYRLAVAALVALALGSELAFPLYALVPPMQKLQFPYRYLPIAAVLASIALVLHLGRGGWGRWGEIGRALVIVLVASYGVQALAVQWSVYRNGERLPAIEDFANRRFGQVEYLLASRGPHWEQYIENGKFAGECARLGIHCEEPGVQRSHGFRATITTLRPVTLRLPIFAYPAWGVNVDGQHQALVTDPDTGLVLVALPAGRHEVQLHWAGLPAERLGQGITLAALAGLILILVAGRLREHHTRRLKGSSTFALADLNPMSTKHATRPEEIV